MMFRKKELPSVPYTESVCDGCGDRQRRPFREGDYVYDSFPCPRCEKACVVTGIYGEKQD